MLKIWKAWQFPIRNASGGAVAAWQVHLKNCLDIILLENKYKFWFKMKK